MTVSPWARHKVDLHETNVLNADGIGELLAMMGQQVDRDQVRQIVKDIGMDENTGLIDRDNFVLYQSSKSPTQVPTLLSYTPH